MVAGGVQPMPISSPHAGLTVAFQPIIQLDTMEIFAQEAFIRGAASEDPALLFQRVSDSGGSVAAFDATCRRRALEEACLLGLKAKLSVNISPQCLTDPRFGLRDTILVANKHEFPINRIIFEITEQSLIQDFEAVRERLSPFRKMGVSIALDDFGAGYNGIKTLINLKPDIIKADISLVKDISTCDMRKAVIGNLVQTCRNLGIAIIAEGVEKTADAEALSALGVSLMQGYLFSRPVMGALAQWP